MDDCYLPVPGCGILIFTPGGGIWPGRKDPTLWNCEKGCNGIPCVAMGICDGGSIVLSGCLHSGLFAVARCCGHISTNIKAGSGL